MQRTLSILTFFALLAGSRAFASSFSYSCLANQRIDCVGIVCAPISDSQNFTVSSSRMEYDYFSMTTLVGKPKLIPAIDDSSITFASQMFGKAGAIGHYVYISGTISTNDGSFVAAVSDVNTGTKLLVGVCRKQ